MSAIEIIEQKPTVAEYNRLIKAVGWPTRDPAAVEAGLARTLFTVCAISGDKVVGMGRIVGDGAIVNYIQDVIVLPAYQKQGIGEKIMLVLMGHLSEHATSGSDVILITRRDNVDFYKRYDFTESRPDTPSMRRKL
jgi:ribosomal protein S18 acetylase RimI-like enzyme